MILTAVFITTLALRLQTAPPEQVDGSVPPALGHYLARKKKRPACRDHRDNDADGLIDYPSDSGCSSRNDKREANPPSQEGVVVGESLAGRQIFPSDNPWNQDISGEPVDSNSAVLIASIGNDTGLHPDFGTFWDNRPMGFSYVVVPGTLAKSQVSFDYADESDSGPYPIPLNPPIEGGKNSDGDRHILMVDRDNWILYELFYAYKRSSGWTAGSGAIFDLNSNDLRPDGWTSADAAGLPILPGLARYDEVAEQGEITHALRFTAENTRRAYVAPARHYASSNTSASLPPMGMRVRLKASFDISGFSAHNQVILRALKKYGMFLADNGSDWFISGTHDTRWDDEDLNQLKSIKGRSFEVVQMDAVTVGD